MSSGASLFAWPLDATGPRVARLYHRLLAGIFFIAWLSLAVQVKLLIGDHGLMPIAGYVAAHSQLEFFHFPTLFLWLHSDAVIVAGTWVGMVLALVAMAGLAPRACLAASTLLYLSYVIAAQSFLGFQWDNLLLECGMLAVFLPRDRRAAWIHWLFRLALFKLYFEPDCWVAVAASRLAGRQRDDVLLRDRADPDAAGVVRASLAGVVAPSREPRDPGARAGRAVPYLRSARGAPSSPPCR